MGRNDTDRWFERRAATPLVKNPQWGEETVIAALCRGGHQLYSDAHRSPEPRASYVRLCGRQGKQIAYWTFDEWGEEQSALPAIISGLAGPTDREFNALNFVEFSVAPPPIRDGEIWIRMAWGPGGALVSDVDGDGSVRATYVRYCDRSGREIGRWEREAFTRAPRATMGEMLACATGRLPLPEIVA